MTDFDITPFLFEGESLVRVISQEGSPWFVAADVCRVLGIQWKGSGNSGTLSSLDEDEKGVTITHTPGGPQEMAIVSESGLYALIFRSRKPTAIRFRKWVTSEVLPAIRKTGGYAAAGGSGLPPQEQGETDNSKLRFVVETRLTWGPKAAQQMWIKKGLETVPAMFEHQQQPDLFAQPEGVAA